MKKSGLASLPLFILVLAVPAGLLAETPASTPWVWGLQFAVTCSDRMDSYERMQVHGRWRLEAPMATLDFRPGRFFLAGLRLGLGLGIALENEEISNASPAVPQAMGGLALGLRLPMLGGNAREGVLLATAQFATSALDRSVWVAEYGAEIGLSESLRGRERLGFRLRAFVTPEGTPELPDLLRIGLTASVVLEFAPSR
ncbi:MAG: hypothetical protein J0L75_05715 [Spirochaetes bacterium]|nr:hypothetical protein [Spirochaetota bacterium]